MNESPFTKEEVQFSREQTTYEKLKDTVVDTLNDNFIDSIPSDDIKQLPPVYLYPIGTLLFSILLAVFLYVFITGYQSGIQQTYLSPIAKPGYTPDKYCETIPIYNSGIYLATETGSWEGQDGFEYSQAAYILTITSFSVTYSEYQELMKLIFQRLAQIAAIAVESDLATNLVYWMALKFVPPGGNTADNFAMGGTPLTIFDRQKTTGAVSNVNGDCNVTSTSTFDSSTGLLTMSYIYSEFISDPMCVQALDPSLFGYVSDVNGEFLTLSIDVRTLITGLAINNRVLDFEDIVEIPSFRANYTYDGTVYKIGSYYDPKYPGMEPLTCIVSSDANAEIKDSCVLRVSPFAYGFPLFNHIGQSLSMPVPCNCSTLTAAELSSPNFQCNEFFLLSGFVFYNTSLPDPMIELFNKDNSTYYVNKASYNASFAASYFGLNSVDRAVLESDYYRQAAYSFCYTAKFGGCSMVTFTSFDLYQYNWAINSYYYQLQRGACSNTFYTSESDWDNLAVTPYSSLTEQYEQCKNDPSTVFLNQVGVSSGNVSIITPVAIAFVMLVLYMYSKMFKINIPKSYSKTDKDRALNTLAISLLLARDNKLTKNHEKAHLESLLMKLVEELAENAETTKNTYVTKEQEEGGLNWSYIAEKAKAKIRNPLHSAGSAAERTERQISTVSASGGSNRLSNVSTVSGLSGGGAGGGIELGTIEHPPAEPHVMSACEKALSANPGLTILNKPSAAQEKLPENKHKTTIATAIVSVEDFIGKFEALSQDKEAGSSPDYWILSSKTHSFGRVRLLTQEGATDVELREFYRRLEEMVILHASLSLNCPRESVLEKYGGSIAYYVNGEVLLLSEIHKRVPPGDVNHV